MAKTKIVGIQGVEIEITQETFAGIPLKPVKPGDKLIVSVEEGSHLVLIGKAVPVASIAKAVN